MNKKTFAQLFTPVSRFFAALFGSLQWARPSWVSYLNKKAEQHPKRFGIFFISYLLILAGLGYSYYQHVNAPKPKLTIARIEAPSPSSFSEDWLTPSSLIMDFGLNGDDGSFNTQSVAPLSSVGKEQTIGIEMKPALAGKWYWETDSRLRFTPEKDWPAGEKYSIHFNKKAFSNQAKLESMNYSFQTQSFEASITDLKFYQDPMDPKIKRAVATINFNFPVNSESLLKQAKLLLQTSEAGRSESAGKPIPYTLSYDKYKRIAYLNSESIELGKSPYYLVLKLDEGIKAEQGPGATTKTVSKNLLIPDAENYLQIQSAKAMIIRNENDRAEQVLSIESSLGLGEEQINKALHVYLLPEKYPANADNLENSQNPNVTNPENHYAFANPGEVSAKVLAASKPLQLQAIPADRQYSSLHNYKFNAEGSRYLYVKIDKGISGFGGYTLKNDYAAIIQVPAFPQEISFLHKGALMALSGEQKLSVLARGLAAVKFNFARVLPSDVNQLITQSSGDFNNPLFINASFNQQNISEIFSEIQNLDSSNLSKEQYTAVDFSKYLKSANNTGGPHGLFLLQANGWDLENETTTEVSANRMILITDLALLVKDNQDGSHDVFVDSISNGGPVANATVSVLGKNGLPLFTANSDEKGRASFPKLSDYINEQEPVVYLASLKDDVSFIPYNTGNRELNFSRFDVGGIYLSNQDQQSITAYVFSDRGIYRPGDTAHIASIVKQAFAKALPAGLLVEATITDPRGSVVFDEKYSLDDLGFLNFDLKTEASSPTGQYYVSLYLVKDQKAFNLLGSTNIQVQEFQPDRMRIKSQFTQAKETGWLSPHDLGAKVELWNLYGAPATDRKVSARVLLEPKEIRFEKYPDYHFVDPLIDPNKAAKVFNESIGDTKTNEKGEAEFKLNLDRFEKASYQLTFFAEGFEADSGKSVHSQTTALVSPMDYFVGYKTDGDLNFIRQNSKRQLSFIAVDPELKAKELSNLTMQIFELQPVSTLVKNPNGTYQYQSIIQSKLIETAPFSLAATGTDFTLPSGKIGNFALHLLDQNNKEISQVKFSVAGIGQTNLAKNAELSVKLDKERYKAGEDIQLQISAPYTGSGLITIERDKVYAVSWFKTDSNSSVQSIHIPEDFQGNGYVNVSFVRDWNSPDIFISPLSYSVQPFEVDHENQSLHISLDVPELAKPGEKLKLNYHTDKPGKIIVFAVDEGILQYAHFISPDPLAFFFQKYALEVITKQTVDQILPQYLRERELSAVGGDASAQLLAAHLNPFKRKTDLPVVYWSGIIDTDNNPREINYEVPEYFNGSLHWMAVAVGLDSLGSAEKNSMIRGDFIINLNVPNFVAPNDEFEISASIANNLKDKGPEAKVTVEAALSPGLEIIGESRVVIPIAEGKEQSVRFKLRANSNLGDAKVSLRASVGDKANVMSANLSIRPATPYTTHIDSGSSSDKQKTISIDQVLYPEYRSVHALMSSNPLILVFGLQQYLDKFPYVCTEQLVSRAFSTLSIADAPWFAADIKTINQRVADGMQLLTQRQMSNGAFSYWPGLKDNEANNFISIYALHFLTEAKSKGYEVPADLFSQGIAFLQDFAARNAESPEMARDQAYAIYVLTRNEIVTSNELMNLQLYLDKDKNGTWKQELTGAYIAASYALLKNQTAADQLIAQYKQDRDDTGGWNDFHNRNNANAQYFYLLAKHFPDRLASMGDSLMQNLVSAVNNNEVNTLLAAYTDLALSAYDQYKPSADGKGYSIAALINKQESILASISDRYGKVSVPEDAKALIYKNPKQSKYFYQLIVSGFAKELPTEKVQNGMEIHREYQDAKGQTVSSCNLGDEIEVHILARATGSSYLNNIAIVDLLPGGFEVVPNSVKSDYLDYADIREDRVVFFSGLDSDSRELVYRIKATSVGKFTLPAIFAESMYDQKIKASTIAGSFTVK